MPLVESTVEIAGPIEAVYELAKDMERYSEYMPDVESVVVAERRPDRTVTDWTTHVDGVPIVWKEEDVFDDQARRIRYRLIEGDLDKFEGQWIFEPASDGTAGTRVTLTVDFDFGMPTLAELLGPILEEKVKENSQMMLSALKAKIEGETK